MSCEYLILNGARINCQDADGKTPLYLATELGIHACPFAINIFDRNLFEEIDRKFCCLYEISRSYRSSMFVAETSS